MARRRARLATVGHAIATLDTRAALPPPKEADAIYKSPEHLRWRAEVFRRAGGRCQAEGCSRADGETRMFADHIRELSDGGAPFDPDNGQLLCGRHHSLKTASERRRRLTS